MATTRTVANPEFVRNDNSAFMELSAPIAIDGGATWKAAEFLRRASDGLMYEGTTSAASGVSDDSITHMACIDLDAAIGADTTFRKFYIVKASDVFEINEKSAAAATLAQVGIHYGMDVTSNVDTVDITLAAHPVFNLVDPTWDNRPFQDDSTDLKPRWLVRVLETAISGVPSN